MQNEKAIKDGSIQADTSTSQFVIEPMRTLPVVDTSITTLGALLGKKHDVAFNQFVIEFVLRQSVFMHICFFLYFVCACLIFFVSDTWMQLVFYIIATITGWVTVLMFVAVISWEPLCLLITKFEYWYLSSIAISLSILLYLMFRDTLRSTFAITVGVLIQSALLIDATVYLRRYCLRAYIQATTAFGVSMLACKLGWTPNLTSRMITFMGSEIDLLDLLINNAFTIGYFMGLKVIPLLHLIHRGGIVDEIRCSTYFPMCHLSPLEKETKEEVSTRRGMHLKMVPLNKNVSNVIDTSITFAPPFAINWVHWIVQSKVFPFIGIVGLVMTFTASIWHILLASTTATVPMGQVVLAVCALVITFIKLILYTMHAQPTLLRLVLSQMDVWFVLFQWITMTLVACVSLNWDKRILLLWAPCLWFYWIMIIDTIPPSTRQKLGYRPWFAVLVNMMLVLHTILLIYWIYYSKTPNITNHIIFRSVFENHIIQMKISTFLASRLTSVGIWMARFFWRQCFWPSNSLKIIKRSVEYQVVQITISHRKVRVYASSK